MTITADYATYAGTGSATNASTYNTATQTPVAGDLVLVAIGSALSAGSPAAPTLTGNGQTWTQLATQVNGLIRLTLFSAVMASPTAGVVGIAFAGITQQRCTWSFGGFRSSLGSPITLGTPAITSGAAATAASVTVVDPGGGDGVYAALYKASTGSVTKDANYTLGEESPAGAEIGWQQTQYRLNSVSDLTPNWSWATAAIWAAGGVVLLEPGGAPVAQPDVIVGGVRKAVVAQSVIVGGVKKPVVNKWVVVAGTKKPVV